MLKDNDMKTE